MGGTQDEGQRDWWADTLRRMGKAGRRIAFLTTLLGGSLALLGLSWQGSPPLCVRPWLAGLGWLLPAVWVGIVLEARWRVKPLRKLYREGRVIRDAMIGSSMDHWRPRAEALGTRRAAWNIAVTKAIADRFGEDDLATWASAHSLPSWEARGGLWSDHREALCHQEQELSALHNIIERHR